MRGQKYELPKPTNPDITFAEAKESFELQGKLEKFKRFADNTKNPFLRKQLYYRQHGICPYCNKPLPYYIYGVYCECSALFLKSQNEDGDVKKNKDKGKTAPFRCYLGNKH